MRELPTFRRGQRRLDSRLMNNLVEEVRDSYVQVAGAGVSRGPGGQKISQRPVRRIVGVHLPFGLARFTGYSPDFTRFMGRLVAADGTEIDTEDREFRVWSYPAPIGTWDLRECNPFPGASIEDPTPDKPVPVQLFPNTDPIADPPDPERPSELWYWAHAVTHTCPEGS